MLHGSSPSWSQGFACAETVVKLHVKHSHTSEHTPVGGMVKTLFSALLF